MIRVSAACMAVLLFACAGSQAGARRPGGTVVTPDGAIAEPQWTPDELSKAAALRNLRRTSEASFHLLRVQGEQPAHVHERSDFVLMMVAGALHLTLGKQELTIESGDVVEVPRGTPIAMKSSGSEAAVAYLVYTPALDLDDRHPVAGKVEAESAWQFNLWPQ